MFSENLWNQSGSLPQSRANEGGSQVIRTPALSGYFERIAAQTMRHVRKRGRILNRSVSVFPPRNVREGLHQSSIHQRALAGLMPGIGGEPDTAGLVVEGSIDSISVSQRHTPRGLTRLKTVLDCSPSVRSSATAILAGAPSIKPLKIVSAPTPNAPSVLAGTKLPVIRSAPFLASAMGLSKLAPDFYRKSMT